MKNYKWCLIRGTRSIEFLNDSMEFRPAFDDLIMNPEYSFDNGLLEITGQEVIFHFISKVLGDGCNLEDLDFIPDPEYIKKKKVGFFRKKEIQYVEDGWVKDSKTRPYHKVFSGYACKFN